MGDRSGSREPKGASLKKSRKNPGASAAKQKKISLKALGVSSGPIASLPPPLPLYGDNHYFDCGVALLSRQFDRDRDRVLQRAHADGHCMGMLVWFSDIEKQSSISDICKTNSGYCYYATGIHPDNIDRTNKKSHDEWLEKVEEMGKKAECLALLSGLNLSREVGTHFSQESLLTSSLQLTKKLQLPLILHLADGKSVERSIEMLYGESSGKDDDDLSGFTASMIIHDVITCTGAEPNFKTLLVEHAQSPTHSLYFIVSGAGITDPDDIIRSKAREFLHDLPNESLLVATDSPWRTPQNLPDAYLRTLRNEPSNIESIVQAMAETKGVDLPTMARILKENTLRVFGMESIRLHAAMPAVQEGNDEEEDEEEEEEVEDHPKATAKHVEEVSKGMKDLKVSGGEKNKKKEEKKEEKKKDKKNNNKKHHQDSDDDDNIEPIKPIHDDHEETEKNNKKKNKKEKEKEKETTTTDVTSSTASAHQYRCVKCRNFVFSAKDITSHSLGASKTVFKVGEEGLCASFHFIPAADGREIHKRLGIQIRGGNVECSQCGMKIGKYSPGEAICPCGAVVTGPVAKINATKIDFHDQTLDAKELAERSKLEIEDAQRQDELDDAEYEAKMQQSAGRVKKAKKHKSENRGNFSNFRNKSFIPNASKTGKKESNAGGGGVEENEEGGGEEEDEEEVESDN